MAEKLVVLATLKSLNPKWENVDVCGEVLIGRIKGECGVSFPDDKLISSKHCKLYKEGNAFFVEDLSSNGTFLNGSKIGKGNKMSIKDGDEISLVVPSAEVAKKKEKVKDIFISYIFQDAVPNDDIYKAYDIRQELGTGNFAVVKLGVNKQTGEKVAVKIIDKKKFALNPALRKDQLMDEVNVMRRLTHPNILAIKDIFESEEYLYLVLELVSDGDLFDAVVSKEHYNEDESRIILGQLASAVGYLHDHGVAHRDLKPENALMADKKKLIIKLSDFGLSKIIGEEQLMKTLCGTPQYLAPEIIFASEGVTDGGYSKAVDVWSLGVILYILLAGFPPFGDSSFEEIKQGKYDYDDPVWEGVSGQAKDLINKMLTVNPKKRYTIQQIFKHPWMKKYTRVEGVNLENFREESTLSVEVTQEVASKNSQEKEKDSEEEEENSEEPSTKKQKTTTTTNNKSKKNNVEEEEDGGEEDNIQKKRKSVANKSKSTSADEDQQQIGSGSIRSRYKRKVPSKEEDEESHGNDEEDKPKSSLSSRRRKNKSM